MTGKGAPCPAPPHLMSHTIGPLQGPNSYPPQGTSTAHSSAPPRPCPHAYTRTPPHLMSHTSDTLRTGKVRTAPPQGTSPPTLAPLPHSCPPDVAHQEVGAMPWQHPKAQRRQLLLHPLALGGQRWAQAPARRTRAHTRVLLGGGGLGGAQRGQGGCVAQRRVLLAGGCAAVWPPPTTPCDPCDHPDTPL